MHVLLGSRSRARDAGGIFALALTLALVVTLTGAALAGPPVTRDPDVRIDSTHSFYPKARAQAPRLQVLGDRVYATYLSRRYFLAMEPYINISTNQGATWNANDHRLNRENPGDPTGDYTTAIPRTAGDGRVYVLLVTNDGPQSVPSVVVSSDGGQTWPTPNVDLTTYDFFSRYEFGIAAASSGRAYVVWRDNSINDQFDRSIFVRRTTDGGATWVARQQINFAEPPTLPPSDPRERSTEPVICADGTSRVYVAWKDKRNPADPNSFKETPGRILLKYSADGGTTYLPATAETRLDRADATSTESQKPAIACDGSGTVVVAWEDNRAGGTTWNVYSIVSRDGGVTWQPSETRVDANRPAGTAARNIKVALGSGNPAPIYVAWEDNRNGATAKDLYFSRSADGLTWSPEVPLNAGPAGLPASGGPVDSWDMSADGANVVVAWADNRGGTDTNPRRDVFINRSTDGGATFATFATRLDLGTGPAVADSINVNVGAGNGGYIAFYQDCRNSDQPNCRWVPPAPPAPQDWPTPNFFVGGFGSSIDPQDADLDAVPLGRDNCPDFPNASQVDTDSDGLGDACDAFVTDPDNDHDLDGFASNRDNCPFSANSDQTDSDADGWGDTCDRCPGTVDVLQRDLDGDGTGDACDTDTDGDGTLNAADPDNDNDGILDHPSGSAGACTGGNTTNCDDNCKFVPNRRQLDQNNNGIGDDCDTADLIVSNLKIAHDRPQPDRALWDKEPGATAYNVYFGLADRLKAGQPGYCYAFGIPFYAEHLAVNPEPGKVFWYLVTARNATTEGSPGLRSDGTPRPTPACSAALASDWDNDGALNYADNCRFDVNVDQADRDRDGKGDLCDAFPGDPTDDAGDHDGTGADVDNCPFVSNPGQADADADGVGDACDDCPANYDPAQLDENRNGLGDACDPDTDGDGIPNATDPDKDGDGVANAADNCPLTFNPPQTDSDGDGVGDACDFNDASSEVRWITFAKKTTRLQWPRTPGAKGYSVYSDDVANLHAGGVYGTCLVPGTTTPFADVPQAVGAGRARYYLVVGQYAGGQGTAGSDSSGNERTVPTGCQ